MDMAEIDIRDVHGAVSQVRYEGKSTDGMEYFLLRNPWFDPKKLHEELTRNRRTEALIQLHELEDTFVNSSTKKQGLFSRLNGTWLSRTLKPIATGFSMITVATLAAYSGAVEDAQAWEDTGNLELIPLVVDEKSQRHSAVHSDEITYINNYGSSLENTFVRLKNIGSGKDISIGRAQGDVDPGISLNYVAYENEEYKPTVYNKTSGEITSFDEASPWTINIFEDKESGVNIIYSTRGRDEWGDDYVIIQSIDVATGELTRRDSIFIGQSPSYEYFPKIVVEGELVAWADYKNSRIRVLDLRGQSEDVITVDLGVEHNASAEEWDPRCYDVVKPNRLIFSIEDKLFSYDIDTEKRKELVSGVSFSQCTAEGSDLVYTTDGGELFLYRLGSSKKTKLISGLSDGGNIGLSKGKLVVDLENEDTSWDIYLMMIPAEPKSESSSLACIILPVVAVGGVAGYLYYRKKQPEVARGLETAIMSGFTSLGTQTAHGFNRLTTNIKNFKRGLKPIIPAQTGSVEPAKVYETGLEEKKALLEQRALELEEQVKLEEEKARLEQRASELERLLQEAGKDWGYG